MPNPIITSVRLSVDELLDNGVFLIELVVLNLREMPNVRAYRRTRVDRSVEAAFGDELEIVEPRWTEGQPHLLGVQFVDVNTKKAIGKAVRKAAKKTGKKALEKAIKKSIKKSVKRAREKFMPDETEIVIVVSNGNGNDPTAVYP